MPVPSKIPIIFDLLSHSIRLLITYKLCYKQLTLALIDNRLLLMLLEPATVQVPDGYHQPPW